MRIEIIPKWAVYLRTLPKKKSMTAVCEQSEWNAMELERPGYHQLIQGDIASETEAEKLARGNQNAGIPNQTPSPSGGPFAGQPLQPSGSTPERRNCATRTMRRSPSLA